MVRGRAEVGPVLQTCTELDDLCALRRPQQTGNAQGTADTGLTGSGHRPGRLRPIVSGQVALTGAQNTQIEHETTY
jgi:hypothetical protein